MEISVVFIFILCILIILLFMPSEFVKIAIIAAILTFICSIGLSSTRVECKNPDLIKKELQNIPLSRRGVSQNQKLPIYGKYQTKTPNGPLDEETYFGRNDKFRKCYQPVYAEQTGPVFNYTNNSNHSLNAIPNCNIGANQNVDEKMLRMGQIRQRDRQAKTGLVAKSIDNYRKYFGKEFEDHESKQWWGNDEY